MQIEFIHSTEFMISTFAHSHYAQRRDLLNVQRNQLSRQSSILSIGRLVAFATLLLGIILYFRSKHTLSLPIALLGLGVFMLLAWLHDRVLQRKKRLEQGIVWAEEGLARLNDQWARKVDHQSLSPIEEHPYESDLDLLGQGSLLQSLDTTRTPEGRKQLAQWLLTGANAQEILLRQKSAQELAQRPEILEAIAVEGAIVARDAEPITPLFEWVTQHDKEQKLSVKPWKILSFILPMVTLGLLIFGSSLPIPRATWVLFLMIQVVLLLRFARTMQPGLEAASNHSSALARYSRMLQVIELASFSSQPLKELQASLVREGHTASNAIHRLSRIVSFMDARRNEVFRLFIGPFFMWDLHCFIALENWRTHAGIYLKQWLDQLARFEALCALATRAFEHPEDAWPEIVDTSNQIELSAQQIGHPLLSVHHVVRNDIQFEGKGAVLLVTGSNMSGKSTLLRSVGSNVALALAGAPVRAQSMRLSLFQVYTSMRIRDSLSEGVSHFLAELKRLKSIVDAANTATDEHPVLFLLDEILHGTNSRERHLGARAIVHHLTSCNAAGAVSTHDLELASLAQELPNHVTNVHFREHITTTPEGNETMSFDYQLRPGVVTTSNALRLMRMVGLNVSLPEEQKPSSL